MLIWIAVAAFGIPILVMYFDNKNKKHDRERRLKEIQRKLNERNK